LLPQIDDALAEEGLSSSATKRKQEDSLNDDGTPKKTKLSGAERRKLTKEEKKAQRGANKGRRWAKVRDEVELCWRFAGSGKCDFGSECAYLLSLLFDPLTYQRCRLSHDIPAYLKAKPRDIFFPSESLLSHEPPFVALPSAAEEIEESGGPSSVVDFPTRCPVFEATGSCRIGLKCRFLGGHMRKAEDGTVSLVEDEERKRVALTANTELNFVSPTTLKLLRTKKVDLHFPPPVLESLMKQQCPTPVSDAYLQALKVAGRSHDGKEDNYDVSVETGGAAFVATPDADIPPGTKEPSTSDPIRPDSVPSASSGTVVAQPAPTKWSSDEAVAQADLPDVPLRFQEKKRLHWSDKTCK
jgi:tRNA-dihydrouridine synthase 3